MAAEKLYFSPKEVEEIWGIKAKTLAQWRWLGKGPAFTNAGRLIKYHKKEIESFMRVGHV